MTELQTHLRAIGACEDGLKFAGDRTAAEAWEACERPDWLGWCLAKTNSEPENRRLAKLYCRLWAEDIAQIIPDEHQAVFAAMLAAVGDWCDNPTEDNRNKARARDRAFARALDRDLDRARALDRDLDLDRARALILALAIDLDLDIDIDINIDIDIYRKWCDAIRAEFECPLRAEVKV